MELILSVFYWGTPKPLLKLGYGLLFILLLLILLTGLSNSFIIVGVLLLTITYLADSFLKLSILYLSMWSFILWLFIAISFGSSSLLSE